MPVLHSALLLVCMTTFLDISLPSPNIEDRLGKESREDDAVSASPPQLANRAKEAGNTKKFWNQFLFQRKPGFQSVLPIDLSEVHQEKCRALPFFQKVQHRDCEPLLLKNHVCFGTCVSGDACVLCSPVAVIWRTVRLRCGGDAEVSKLVATVEDCRCEAGTAAASGHRRGPGLVDPSVGNQD
uniref:CTCK domain-containing protein n=1 Tax=Denticeps clupeoides TaxID=299321 RepID=A0AAY4ABJ1_9TELE